MVLKSHVYLTLQSCTYFPLITDMEGADPFASDGEDMMMGPPDRRPTRPTSPAGASAAGSGSTASNSSFQSALPSSSTTSSVTTLSQQIRKLKNAANAPRVLGGYTTIRTTNYGSLVSERTDGRHKMAYQRELYDAKITVATSFDPSSLLCYNCEHSPHHILKTNSQNDPTCFILSDQCFPPALPSRTDARCLAIIRVEDASLADLVTTFLRLTRGCNVAVGSVVVICSINHLGSVGSAAYAEDLVEALSELRRTFRGQVRSVHGFPILPCELLDPATIRGLLEIEAWLTSVDQRRSHSLRSTSEFFVNTVLTTRQQSDNANLLAAATMPLRMPVSLFSKERSAFVGLGWPNMAAKIPPPSSSDEQLFLSTMLHELNLEFAMQLDTNPCTDRLLTTSEVIRGPTIIVGGGSHAGRLAEALRSTHPEVVDLSMSGWRISETGAAELASDIAEALDDDEVEDPVVILHLFDNSLYKGTQDGEMVEPVKANSKYHIVGDLQVANSHQIKQLFELAMPILRAARGSRVILLGPLPRYVVGPCCNSPEHITNFSSEEYVKFIRNSLKDVGIQLKNLLQTRRIKCAKLVNPAVLMGLLTTPRASPERMLELWGPDPVHASKEGYKNLATCLMEEAQCGSVLHPRKPSSSNSMSAAASASASAAGSNSQKREDWTASTATVAARTDTQQRNRGGWRSRGGHSGGRGGHGGRGLWKRGGRGHRGRPY